MAAWATPQPAPATMPCEPWRTNDARCSRSRTGPGAECKSSPAGLSHEDAERGGRTFGAGGLMMTPSMGEDRPGQACPAVRGGFFGRGGLPFQGSLQGESQAFLWVGPAC